MVCITLLFNTNVQYFIKLITISGDQAVLFHTDVLHLTFSAGGRRLGDLGGKPWRGIIEAREGRNIVHELLYNCRQHVGAERVLPSDAESFVEALNSAGQVAGQRLDVAEGGVC